MKNNEPNNNYTEAAIDLRELFNIIINHKKIIIIITLICGVIATGYAYSQKPIYKSSVSFIGPSINITSQLMAKTNNLEIITVDNFTILHISTIGESIEKNEIALKEVIDFILVSKNEEIKDSTQFLTKELERLNGLDKTLSASSGIEQTISQLTLLIKPKIYYEILKAPQTKLKDPKPILTILVGFIAGFLLSIFVVFIRQILFQEQK
jgi:LPS O-antigen subunit length determinant protein (WzzB/FepE family)